MIKYECMSCSKNLTFGQMVYHKQDTGHKKFMKFDMQSPPLQPKGIFCKIKDMILVLKTL